MRNDNKKAIIYKGQPCELWGGLYVSVSKRFYRGILPNLSRTLKANCNDAAVVVAISPKKMAEIERYYATKKKSEIQDNILEPG